MEPVLLVESLRCHESIDELDDDVLFRVESGYSAVYEEPASPGMPDIASPEATRTTLMGEQGIETQILLDGLLDMERELRPNSNYLEFMQGPLIKEWMRRETVEWILEVCEHHAFLPETFALAVNYFDRYLSVAKAKQSQLQLVGAVALSLAVKFRETDKYIKAETLSQCGDNSFTADFVLRMEPYVLRRLEHRLYAVTPFDFLEIFLTNFRDLIGECDVANLRMNANTLLEYSVIKYEFLDYMPSTIAASALLLAIRTVQSRRSRRLTKDDVTAYINDTSNNVADCMRRLQAVVTDFQFTQAYLSQQAETSCDSPSPSATPTNIVSASRIFETTGLVTPESVLYMAQNLSRADDLYYGAQSTGSFSLYF
eukprot:Opistho-1_new@100273